MPWIKRDGYGESGKRHYFDSQPEILIIHTEDLGDDWLRVHYKEWVSNALCGADLSNTGTYTISERTQDSPYLYRWGGLSVHEPRNLLQRNLCSYCLKAYIAARPELAAAAAQLG